MSFDFVKTLKAPLNVDGWFVKLLIGGILLCVPIANFIVIGYCVKYLKKLINKEDSLPDYGDLGGLFVSGFKFFVGSIVYMIPFGLLIFILSMLLSKAAVTAAILTLVLELVAGILILPMIINFALDEKILSMVDFEKAFCFLKNSVKDFLFLIVYIVLLYIVYMIIIFVCSITLVGLVLVPFLAYAMSLSLYNLLGQYACAIPNLKN